MQTYKRKYTKSYGLLKNSFNSCVRSLHASQYNTCGTKDFKCVKLAWEFYGDLVHKFKTIVGMADFSDQFRKKYRTLQTYWI